MMKTRLTWMGLLLLFAMTNLGVNVHAVLASAPETEGRGWKLYTNARFGFSIRYPDGWRLGNPMPDGVGVTLYPPLEQSLVAVSGHMNVVSGSSPEGRQTIEEFASAHRRIMTELYGKKNITIRWQSDQERTLAGFPGKELTFAYTDDRQNEIIEHHIFSLGRNEGRGIRVKVPRSAEDQVMATVRQMLDTYQPGRDQNAVSPLLSKPDPPR
jgi:hypothetical protein